MLDNIGTVLLAVAIMLLAGTQIYDGLKIRRLRRRVEALEDQVDTLNKYQGVPRTMPY